MTSKKWQQDKHFCDWLLKMEYTYTEKKRLMSHIGEGTTLYMWEAYQEGVKFGRRQKGNKVQILPRKR